MHRRAPERPPGHQRRNGMAGAVERRDHIRREKDDRERYEQDFDDAQIELSGMDRDAATDPPIKSVIIRAFSSTF